MKAMILTGDYWHSTESIRPLIEKLFPDGNYIITEDPDAFFNSEYDVLVNFKDPIENDQIPTPIWCNDKWTDKLLSRIKNGMGYIAVHAAVTDLPEDHRIVKEIYGGVFVTHPAPCDITFELCTEHPVLEGVGKFKFAEKDEHYVMKMMPEDSIKILANTTSEHGTQPALWVREYGKGRVCMFTPGHTTKLMISSEYIALMRNMVKWVKNDL